MELLGILLGCLVLGTIFLPWFHAASLSRLKNEISSLGYRLQNVEAELRSMRGAARPSAPAESPDSTAAESMPVSALPEKEAAPTSAPEIQGEVDFVFEADEHREMERPPAARERAEKTGFEMQFGARLPVWGGGIALALAGFFLVKYSIEMGWLSPAVRLVVGVVFGIGLLFAGDRVRKKPGFADGTRIAQALSGAGIADLYVCAYAACELYHFIHPALGFLAMAVVTATAVVLSLRHGPPIALLGMAGGFLTPALITSEHPSAFLLFAYLYLVLTGLMTVVRQQKWWGLGIAAVVACFAWVVVWLIGGAFVAADALWLGLFLLAASGTVTMLTPQGGETAAAAPVKSLNHVAAAGALALMGFVAGKADFGLMEWGMSGLMAAGGIALAYFRQETYRFVPWVALSVNAVMFIIWQPGDSETYALVLASFAALYGASGWLLQWQSRAPLLWAAQAAMATLGAYLMGYFRLHAHFAADHLWSELAFAGALACTWAAAKVLREVDEAHVQKQHLLAVYAATATAFISCGLTVELDREFLSVAVAAEALALSWIYSRVNIAALRQIAGIVAAAFGVLLIPQAILIANLSAYSLFELKMDAAASVPVIEWPLFQLGLPALAFLGAAFFLRQKGDGRQVRVFEIVSVILAALTGYYATRHLMHPGENILFVKAGFVERGAITNALFVFGLGCLYAGRRFAREALSSSGFVLCAVAAFRIFYFDLLIHNPLWSSGQAVGTWPIANALLLTYGLPVVWLWRVAKDMQRAGKNGWLAASRVFMLALSFVLVSFEVTQVYHGAILSAGETGNAEIYTYSAAWLVFGLSLLLLGTLRKDRMIRVASLGIMILTVGKVFLYDASALTGLYRVFSFFGLGLSLLSLSWFYSRFVFPAGQKMKGE